MDRGQHRHHAARKPGSDTNGVADAELHDMNFSASPQQGGSPPWPSCSSPRARGLSGRPVRQRASAPAGRARAGAPPDRAASVDRRGRASFAGSRPVGLVRNAVTALIWLEGEIDLRCRAELEKVAAQIELAPSATAIVDLGDVTFLGGAGLDFVARLHRAVTPGGGTVVLLRPARIVAIALAVGGLSDQIQVITNPGR